MQHNYIVLLGLVAMFASAVYTCDPNEQMELVEVPCYEGSDETCYDMNVCIDNEGDEGEGDVDKRASGFIRIGKRARGFLRIGKRASGFLRIGKRASGFLRIGKRSGEHEEMLHNDAAIETEKRGNSGFLRVGRMSPASFMRDTRASGFLRIGRR